MKPSSSYNRRLFLRLAGMSAAAAAVPRSQGAAARPAFEVSASLYAWDLHDEGIEKVLDNLQQMSAVNSVYLVASNYSNKRSLIIDPDGRILADTGGKSGIVLADVDLGARTFGRWMWFDAYGDWKTQYPAERRTETYGPLLEERGADGQAAVQ